MRSAEFMAVAPGAIAGSSAGRFAGFHRRVFTRGGAGVCLLAKTTSADHKQVFDLGVFHDRIIAGHAERAALELSYLGDIGARIAAGGHADCPDRDCHHRRGDARLVRYRGTGSHRARLAGLFRRLHFGSGFASAILPLAAQAEGRNDPTHVRRSVRMGMWILLLYAVLVMPFLWFLEPALIGLGQKPELAALASDYIRIAQWAMFPALMMMALRSFFAARSRAGIVLWSALIGTLVNGVLNYALIFGHFGAPEMGVRGAAVASVVSSTVIFLIMAGWAVLHPRHLEYRLFQRFWRPEWPAFFEVFRLGLPIGFTILAEVGLFMAASVMMGWLGTVPLAAHGIAIQLASISFMVPLGLSHAATVRIGQAYGRGDMEGLARAAHTVMGLSVVIALASGALFWIFPEALVSLFLDEANADAAELLKVAVPLVLVAAAFQLVDAVQAIAAGLLRGIKDTRTPMIIAVISYWPIACRRPTGSASASAMAAPASGRPRHRAGRGSGAAQSQVRQPGPVSGCGEGLTSRHDIGFRLMSRASATTMSRVASSAGNRCSIFQSARAMSSAVENWLMVEKKDSVMSPRR
jgi:MATE family multidrug resistance protein